MVLTAEQISVCLATPVRGVVLNLDLSPAIKRLRTYTNVKTTVLLLGAFIRRARQIASVHSLDGR